MANFKPLYLTTAGEIENPPPGDTVTPSFLGTGTANANTLLHGDGTWGAVNLNSVQVSGTLQVGNGGTGVTSSTGSGSVVLSASPTLTGNVTITDNSVNPALFIQQEGTGDVLRIFDAATDATPFVINADGRVLVGYPTSAGSTSGPITSIAQIVGTGGTAGLANDRASLGMFRYFADNGSARTTYAKSRSAAPGTFAAVAAADTLGLLTFEGDDGTAFSRAAQMVVRAEGTISTGVVPGRFEWQVANSAGVMAAAMWLTSGSQFALGNAIPSPGRGVTFAVPTTGATTAHSLFNAPLVQSDVTVAAYYNHSFVNLASAAFTVANLYGHSVGSAALSGGAAITNLHGFHVPATYNTGANNYGFRGQLAAAANTYNLYMDGTADNFLGGNLNVSVNTTGDAVRITQVGTGNALVVEDSANPDATPFVIDATGRVISGHTIWEGEWFSSANTPTTFNIGQSANAIGYGSVNYGGPGNFWAARSNGASIGARGSVSSGDVLGQFQIAADDGGAGGYMNAGLLRVVADAAPSTGIVPGRWEFYSTNAAGVQSAAFFIDSAQRVTIGPTGTVAGRNLGINKTMTGATTAYSILNASVVQSDVTAQANYYHTLAATQAAAFTLPLLHHFNTQQGTFGAGSSVTTQVGYRADSSMTGATNNYGFQGALVAATNVYNLYMSGTAENFLSGNVGIGAVPAGQKLYVTGNTKTGGLKIEALSAASAAPSIEIIGKRSDGNQTTAFGAKLVMSQNQTNALLGNGKVLGAILFGGNHTDGTIANTAYAASFQVRSEGPFNSAADMPTRMEFRTGIAGDADIDSTGSPAFGTIALQISSAQNVAIGPTGSQAGRTLSVNKALTGATTAYGILLGGTVQSDVTAAAYGVQTLFGTQAATFTLPFYAHYAAAQGTIGAGSTVTSQNGFFVASTMTGATQNFGFRSQMAAATGRWNLYMDGTADNYINGNLLAGSTFALTNVNVGNVASTPSIQDTGGNTNASSIVVARASANISGPSMVFAKQRSVADFTVNTAVISGDQLGILSFNGNDGTNYVDGGVIIANADGTIATGSVPTRLSLYFTNTTAGVFPLETMRLSSNGGVNIGIGAQTATGLGVSKSITGGATSIGMFVNGQIQSDVGTAWGYRNSMSVAPNFTLNEAIMYGTLPGAIGAASMINTYYGFYGTSAAPGVVNYVFRGNLTREIGTDPGTYTITNVARTANVVTVTVSATHSYVIGQQVGVGLTTNVSLNGLQTITGVGANTFTYASTGADITSVADTGSVVAHRRYNLYMAGTADNYMAGNVYIGTSATGRSNLNFNGLTGQAPQLQMIGPTTMSSSYFGFRGNADALGPHVVLGKARTASVLSTVVVQSGDALGSLTFVGADGTNFVEGAAIRGEVDGTPGTNDMPGRLVMLTSPDGSATLAERFRVSSFGGLGIGGANFGTAATQALVSGGAAAPPVWADVITPALRQTGSAVRFTTAGTTTAYTLTPTPAIGSLVAGQRFRVVINATNTSTTPTLAVSGLAATAFKKYSSAGAKIDPAVGDLAANMITDVEYDGTHWVIIDQLPSVGGGGVSDGDKGDITVTASGATWTIDAATVTLAKMANLAANSIIGNNTGAGATPIALSVTQVTAMLDAFTSGAKGLAPASGGGTVNYLRADGTWVTPPSGDVHSFGGSGTPTTGNDKTSWLRVMKAETCVNASLVCKTAPSGGSFVVAILKSADNGATFPVTVATLTITTGNKTGTVSTTTAMAAGDLLRLDITSVNGAADWTAQLYATGA